MSLEQPEKETFDPHTICIATATFYKNWYPGPLVNSEKDVDKIRGDLALQLFKDATEKGYQLVVVDGGSSSAFISEMENSRIEWSKEEERGMSPSRRQAFRIAAGRTGVKVIGWTEPEKIDIVSKSAESLSRPILSGDADIVVPRRTKKSFSTYPNYQVESERKLNSAWNDVFRKFGLLDEGENDLDVSFGPKFFRNDPKILSLFLARYEVLSSNATAAGLVRPDSYSNATFFPIPAALKEGFRVISVDVDDFVYPSLQANIESDSDSFRKKRLKQRTDIVSGAIEFGRFLNRDPKSKLIKK